MASVEESEGHAPNARDHGRGREYPSPVLVAPKSGTHKQSFVILHGRGSTGEEFGQPLLNTAISGFGALQTAFPDAKFIFPTASRRRARLFNRSLIHQWFDNWSLEHPSEREELQFDGLRESSLFVHSLLKSEIEAVGAKNVVLWGLSQGCALSLTSLFLWDGEPIAAAIGMCGWLPLQKRMEDALFDSQEGLSDDDPFAADEESSFDAIPKTTNFSAASACVREMLRVPLRESCAERELATPVFIGHGILDEKVPVRLALDAAGLLAKLEVDVSAKQYNSLGHWYSGDMLGDIVLFLKRKAGFQNEGNFNDHI